MPTSIPGSAFRPMPVVARPACLAAGLVAGMALAACGSGDTQPGPPRHSAAPTRTLADLTDAEWADVIDDVDCSTTNMGVEVLGVRFADVRGTGVPDAFVWVDCVHLASTWPHQLEVFDGSSAPANPKRMAVLQSTRDGLLVKSVSFAGSTVRVDSAGYAESDPMCCPSLTVQRSFTWTGAHFAREQG